MKSYQVHCQETCPDKKQFKLDLSYLQMAAIWGNNSHCNRSKVGCLVVKDKAIISDGYNGTPSGFPNPCEDINNKTLNTVLHSEANAITKLAKGSFSSHGATMYVTLSPCFDCAKLIIQSGIVRIVFSELYRVTDSFSLLTTAGIEVIQIDISHKSTQ